MAEIKRALISVTNKEGVLEFARELASLGVHVLSTGGTARVLREGGLKVTDVSEYTGFPEMLDGRVKTLHPKIHGGLLGLRSNPDHVRIMKEHGIENIDLVVINLYPFKQAISKPGCTLEEAIENIDIGGPAMLRSAAKNNESVTVIIDPSDYGRVLDDIRKTGGVSRETNFMLAIKVFETTSSYDSMIAGYLKNQVKK
jgi:phosphoribosylaminoimidazolecarboxamide formyltransferase/IMP cyclohydrolase